jgi:predicted RNA-binding Zn-ribbon protein involved in translation (DUF1610 family)
MRAGDLAYFRCNECTYTAQVHEEGNPYLMDWRGQRWYYAPSQPAWQVILEIEYEERRFLSDLECRRLLQKRGNASEHVCLTCGRITWIDPARDCAECWWCGASVVQGTLLDGQRCPKCRDGTLLRVTPEPLADSDFGGE